jgi:hypothetical protein
MTLAIKKTIYPDGKEKMYINGMKAVATKAPQTKEFNKWMETICNKLKRNA